MGLCGLTQLSRQGMLHRLQLMRRWQLLLNRLQLLLLLTANNTRL